MQATTDTTKKVSPSPECLHCPICGVQTLRVIESTEKDAMGEYKDVCTCDQCKTIVYIVRGV